MQVVWKGPLMSDEIRTFINDRGIFHVSLEGEVTQVEGDPVSRPAEYVLAQFLNGRVDSRLLKVFHA